MWIHVCIVPAFIDLAVVVKRLLWDISPILTGITDREAAPIVVRPIFVNTTLDLKDEVKLLYLFIRFNVFQA